MVLFEKPVRPRALGPPSQNQAGPAQDPWPPKPKPSRPGPGPLAPQAKPVRPRTLGPPSQAGPAQDPCEPPAFRIGHIHFNVFL